MTLLFVVCGFVLAVCILVMQRSGGCSLELYRLMLRYESIKKTPFVEKSLIKLFIYLSIYSALLFHVLNHMVGLLQALASLDTYQTLL
mgnify:CR=1 FL=1